MQESVVYSIGYIYLYVFYQLVQSYLHKEKKRIWILGIGTIIMNVALLLTKQTGEVFALNIFPLIPLIIYFFHQETYKKLSLKQLIRRFDYANLLKILGIALVIFVI